MKEKSIRRFLNGKAHFYQPRRGSLPAAPKKRISRGIHTGSKRLWRRPGKGQEIVVVMGVGFVGAVMAAIVADTTDASGTPHKFVIGMQRPSLRSYWKIPVLNQGISPSRPRTRKWTP